jgi:hypothetical protein
LDTGVYTAKTILDLGSAGGLFMKPGDVVLIQAFDKLEHVFRMQEDCVASQALSGRSRRSGQRCNKRRSIHPDHLEIGSSGENLQDKRDFSANWVDFGLL